MHLRDQYMPALKPPECIRYCYSAEDYDLYIDMPISSRQSSSVSIAPDPSSPNSVAAADSLSGLHAAIALAECDSLLVCVSNWLKQDLDWQPCGESTTFSSIGVTLAPQNASQPRIGLSSRRNCLPTITADLQANSEVHTHVNPVRICLSTVKLSTADQSRLGPGCCVLLPDTFSETFIVSMVHVGSSAKIANAVLDKKSCSVSSIAQEQGAIRESLSNELAMHSKDSASTSEINDNSTLRVFLKEPVDINISHWLYGAAERADDDLTSDNQLASKVHIPPLQGLAVVVEQDGADAVGAQLCQVGDGLAILFDTQK